MYFYNKKINNNRENTFAFNTTPSHRILTRLACLKAYFISPIELAVYAILWQIAFLYVPI